MSDGSPEIVTITAQEYASLLAARRRLAFIEGVRPDRRPPLSRVERDPEVADYLASAIGRQLVREAREVCLQRFGPERAPSRSAIHRFWQMLVPGYGRANRQH